MVFPKVIAVAAALVMVLGFSPAIAQDAPPADQAAVQFAAELDAVRAACLVNDATTSGCKAAIAAYVAAAKAAGLTGDALDDALAVVVVALAENASALSPEVRLIVAAEVRVLAQEFTNPERAALVAEIATSVEQGEDVQTAAIEASPNEP